MQRIVVMFSLLLFTLTAYARAENFHIIAQKELPVAAGTFRTIEWEMSDQQTGILYAVTFKPSYRAHFHWQENKIQFFADYLDTLSRHHDFMVGINGGFYQPNFTPAGLFIFQGKTIRPMVHSSLVKTCILIDQNRKIHLETPPDQCTRADNAMQAGPLLVENGAVNAALAALSERSPVMKDFFSPHKRTLLALADDRQLILITTTPFSLTDLARFLVAYPEAFGVKKIRLAVNLDGGSSTGMYIRFPDNPFYFHELKHVKTFIFID